MIKKAEQTDAELRVELDKLTDREKEWLKDHLNYIIADRFKEI